MYSHPLNGGKNATKIIFKDCRKVLKEHSYEFLPISIPTVRSVIYPQQQFPVWYFGRGVIWACCRTGAEVEGDDALHYCSIYIDWLMQYT